MSEDKLKKEILKVMLRNRRIIGTNQYTVPSPQDYPYQWFWDSCFNAIILTHYNIEDAKKEIRSLISKQFENGLIPHMIYWEKITETDFPVIEWGKKDTSTITQPPMIAYTVLRIYQKDGDRQFLSQIYDHLKRFYRYLLHNRDPRNNHLIGIINPDESGEDNSPRFDIPLGLKSKQANEANFQKRLDLVALNESLNFEITDELRNIFWVKDVPFNVVMIKNLRTLSKIAKILDHQGDSKLFLKESKIIVKAMRKLMFDQGIFWSTYGLDYKKIKTQTWAIFAPMFAQIYTKDEVKNLVSNYLLNKKKFNLKYMVPSVAADDPSFAPAKFRKGPIWMTINWRGPVWMAVNWFIYKGLINYKLFDLADKIKKDSLCLIEKSGFREQYDPFSGEGMGAKHFTWGGLVVDMEKDLP